MDEGMWLPIMTREQKGKIPQRKLVRAEIATCVANNNKPFMKRSGFIDDNRTDAFCHTLMAMQMYYDYLREKDDV